MPDKVMKLIDELIAREGGYVNDPRDAGGETKFGITIAVARANGYMGPMKDLPRSVAAAIYRAVYWVKPGFHMVALHYPRVAEELFDTGVNMGPKVAVEFLQRALSVFHTAIAQDGVWGGETLRALEAFKQTRGKAGETVLLRALDAQQAVRYMELTEKRVANRAFVYGWIANRIGNVK